MSTEVRNQSCTTPTYRLTKRRQLIATMFAEIEADNPSKSDEWLIAVTCGHFLTVHHQEINNTDVCEALIARGQAGERTKDVSEQRKSIEQPNKT
jgi:hypothetical protein